MSEKDPKTTVETGSADHNRSASAETLSLSRAEIMHVMARRVIEAAGSPNESYELNGGEKIDVQEVTQLLAELIELGEKPGLAARGAVELGDIAKFYPDFEEGTVRMTIAEAEVDRRIDWRGVEISEEVFVTPGKGWKYVRTTPSHENKKGHSETKKEVVSFMYDPDRKQFYSEAKETGTWTDPDTGEDYTRQLTLNNKSDYGRSRDARGESVHNLRETLGEVLELWKNGQKESDEARKARLSRPVIVAPKSMFTSIPSSR